jgi:hypothetical protein
LIDKIIFCSNWWPTFVIIFYVLCPIPLAIGRRCASDGGYGTRESSPCTDLMWFITSAIVVSAFGLPAIMCRAGVVSATKVFFIFYLFIHSDSCWFNEFYHGSKRRYIYNDYDLFYRIWI